MAECILMKNGGGVKSDDTTANANNVLLGKTFLGAGTDDDIGVGAGINLTQVYAAQQGTRSGWTASYTSADTTQYLVVASCSDIAASGHVLDYRGGASKIFFDQTNNYAFAMVRTMLVTINSGSTFSFYLKAEDSNYHTAIKIYKLV